MARRGRFGRAEAGSSNLSSLIQQLIREQKAAEERLLLEAFYNGSALYGSVPTMNDVISFYKDLADLGGFDENSMEWQALLQKIEQANNFDINREYNRLTDEFELTNGANYEQLNAFLKGRAMDSTNQDHLSTYQKAVSDYAFSYLNLKGQVDLKGGAITVEEYRSLVGGLLETIGKDSPNYYNALVTAYTHEWNSENQKYYDRFQAGNISKGQYLSFVKEFQNSAVAAGIDKNSTLYTGTLSAAATVRQSGGGGGTSASRKRYDKSLDNLAAIWNTINDSLGIDSGFDAGPAFESQDSVLEKIRKNPESAAMYAAYIDDNPLAIPSELRKAGVTDGTSFLELWDNGIKELKNNADAAYTTGALPKGSWDKVGSVWTVTGSATYQDEIQYVGNKYLDDRTSAKANPFLMGFYDREYEKYLLGKDSYYGRIPDDARMFNPELISVELAKLRGDKGAQNAVGITTWGLSSDETKDVNSIIYAAQPTKEEIKQLKSGKLVNTWDEKAQGWVAAAPQGNGLKDGVYQYVKVERLPDGSYYSFTAVAFGTRVNKSDGSLLGYRYEVPDALGANQPVVIGVDGTMYDADNFRQSGADWIVGTNGPIANLGKAPRVDYSQATYQGYDRTIGTLDRTGVVPSLTPEAMIEIQRAAQDGLAGLPETEREEAKAGIADVEAQASAVKALRIQEAIGNGSLEDTPEARLEIIGLTKGIDSQEYRDQSWIVQNQDNLVQVGPYDWRFKSDYQSPGKQGLDPATSALAGFTAGAASGALVGSPLGPLGIGAGGLIGGAVGAIGGLGASVLSGLEGNPQFEALAVSERLKPSEYKKAQRERVAASAQDQQYKQTGYPAGSNVFFRNVPTPKQPASSPISPSGYLGLQANIPMPKTPSIPTIPKPQALGFKALTKFSGDSLKERRESAIRATTNQPASTPVYRRPGGP